MPVPYAGNPTNFPKSVDILSGGDAPSSTNFNTAYEGCLDRTAYLYRALSANAGANWARNTNINPNVVSNGGSYIWSGCWDVFFGQWIVANTITNGGVVSCQLNASYNGHDWFVLQPILSNNTWYPIAMATQPDTGVIAVIRTDGTSNWSVTTQLQGNASVEQTVTGGMVHAQQGVMVYFYSTVNAALKCWLFVGGTGFTGHTPWNGCALAGDANVTTWTNLSADLPPNFAPPPASSSNSVFQWLACTDESFPLAGDANNLLVAQCGYRPGVDKSYLLQWNQANALTFNDVTPSFLASGAYQIRGIAWSPIDQLWGMICIDGDSNGHGASPANSYFLTSPDLVTWTTVHTFLDWQAGGLACTGSIWSQIGWNTFFQYPSNRVLYSNNVSLGTSQIWNAANYQDQNSIGALATSGYSGRLYLGNSHQFLQAVLLGGTSLSTTFIADVGTSQTSMAGV